MFIDAALKMLIFLCHLILALFVLKYYFSLLPLFDLYKVEIIGVEATKVCDRDIDPLWLIQTNFLSIESKDEGLSPFLLANLASINRAFCFWRYFSDSCHIIFLFLKVYSQFLKTIGFPLCQSKIIWKLSLSSIYS